MASKSLNAQLKAITEISKAITSSDFLDDILKLIVVVIAELMNSNICSLSLIDKNTNELIIKATQSVSELYNNKTPLKVGEGIAGKVAETNKAITIKDLSSEKNYKYKDVAIKEGLKSLLCVPLAVKGKVIGVLNCYTPELHNFTKNEINLLTTIANQAAIAIENTNLMMQSKIIQEELEKRKLLDRAKGILINDTGITEEKAYLKIKKFAMDNRKTIREVAESIIMSAEIKTL